MQEHKEPLFVLAVNMNMSYAKSESILPLRQFGVN